MLWLRAPSPETGTGKGGLMAHWTAVAPVTQRCHVAHIQQDADAASRNMLSGWDDLPHSSEIGVGQRRYDQQEQQNSAAARSAPEAFAAAAPHPGRIKIKVQIL